MVAHDESTKRVVTINMKKILVLFICSPYPEFQAGLRNNKIPPISIDIS